MAKYVIVSKDRDYISDSKSARLHLEQTCADSIMIYNSKGTLLNCPEIVNGKVHNNTHLYDGEDREFIAEFAKKNPVGTFVEDVEDWFYGREKLNGVYNGISMRITMGNKHLYAFCGTKKMQSAIISICKQFECPMMILGNGHYLHYNKDVNYHDTIFDLGEFVNQYYNAVHPSREELNKVENAVKVLVEKYKMESPFPIYLG